MNRYTKLFFVLLFVLFNNQALAAVRLISTATGNINATGTWSVIDITGTNAFLNSETANTALTTSPVASSTFTPAAETVTAIGVKLASVAATPTGTMTIKLANSTSAGNRECTQTVNVADLPTVVAAATADGGWIILTCAASPNGTDAYTITASTSSASQVNLFSLATTNWSRLVVTNGTQASGPAAGDQFMVFGQLTGAGTHNAYVVTINTTALVNYGNVANTLVDPSIAVGQWGTLASGVTASTAYVSEVAGPVVVYNGGTFTLGTSGTPVPSTSTMVYTLNATVEGDTGINVRNGGTFNSAGVSGGRTVVKTLLTATASAAGTSLTTADSTGWLNGDAIVIAVGAADTNLAHYDPVSMTAGASGTTLTIGALAFTHNATAFGPYTAPNGKSLGFNMYPEVVVLTRNVKIQGSGASTGGYIYGQANSNFASTWTEFNQIAGGAVSQRGIEADTGPLGTFSLTNSSIHDGDKGCLNLAPTNTNFGGPNASLPVLVQHVVEYNCGTGANGTYYGIGIIAQTTNPFWKMDDVTMIHSNSNAGAFSSGAFYLGAQNGQFSNITISSSGWGGTSGTTGTLQFQSNYSGTRTLLGGIVGNQFGPITEHANGGASFTSGASNSTCCNGTVQGWYIWSEADRFIPPISQNLIIDPFYIVQNYFGLYFPSNQGTHLTVRNGAIGFTSNNASMNVVTIDGGTNSLTFDNMDLCPFGVTGGVTFLACGKTFSFLADVTGGCCDPAAQTQITLRNSSIEGNLGATFPTLSGTEGYFGVNAFITQDCVTCTSPAIPHDAWLPGGFINYDTAVTHSSGYSLRMTPKLTTFTGYITNNASAGTGTLTITANTPTALGGFLTSDGANFVNGTVITAGSSTSYTVNQQQPAGFTSACNSGTPCHFQSYNYGPSGTLLRLQSAPFGRGVKVAVASGVANAQACVWLRPSINTDAAPTWGGSAVTYNGDQPRMINRQNPYMGVQADTVLGTASLSAGTWGQFCATLPTAPTDGEFEIVVDADQTFTSNVGGSINVAEWSCTNCANANTSQFWWNGLPSDAIGSASGGTSGVGAYIH